MQLKKETYGGITMLNKKIEYDDLNTTLKIVVVAGYCLLAYHLIKLIIFAGFFIYILFTM